MKIGLIPVFENQDELTEHYYRLHWYLYPFSEKIEQITIFHDIEKLEIGKVPDHLDQSISDCVGKLPIVFKRVKLAELVLNDFIDFDVVFLTESDLSQADKIPDSRYRPLIKNKKVIKVDHKKERFASSFYLMLGNLFEDEMTRNVLKSKGVFNGILSRCKSSKGYIFGTGPNLSEASDYDFSDGVSIACNSMVRNRKLMDRLQPRLVVVADPIFHAGPSSYAGQFRSELIEALDRYNADLIVPIRDYHIYITYLPERLRERIAGVPFKKQEVPNLDLGSDFFVATTANVLTLFLLPLASTFFDETRIFGCDGRPSEENSYFWKHDKASQLNEKMSEIKCAHPAFFDIDYDDYYEQHCKVLDVWLNKYIEKNKKIYNITKSYIPALKNITLDIAPKTSYSSDRLAVVMIDPDGKDESGHWLAYNDRLAEACETSNHPYYVFGSKHCADESLRKFFLPTFNNHSWIYKQGADIPNFKYAFNSSLKKVLEENERVLVYVYCGSIAVAQAINEVIQNFPDVTAVVTLFWTSFDEYKSPEYISKWKPIIESLVQSKWVRLLAPTEQFSNSFELHFGVKLATLKHPSTTISDPYALKLLDKEKQCNDPIRLGFPGGVSESKGFHLTSEFVQQLVLESDLRIDIVVRASVFNPSPKHLSFIEHHINLLRKSGCQISEQELTLDEFIKFLDSIDIIVLPYQASAFGERTSGLVIDAIYLGKPLIVMSNTWLAEVVNQYGIGEVVDGYDSLLTAIEKISANIDVYYECISKAQKDYFSKNSWSQLLIQLKEQEMEPLCSSYSREDHVHFDETYLISRLMLNDSNSNKVMVDVGAHHGSSLSPFAQNGWRVYAFEPNSINRKKLVASHGKKANVTIDTRAVGDSVQKNVAFFTSEVSTGISGMLAFHPSHEEAGLVDVTTVKNIIEENSITKINFLKIDVEGYDLSVLRGVPWETHKPDVIECEFEDAKTKLLGHNWRYICDYLVEKGYTVYVSEWHPIIRYGIPHDWHTLSKYPCDLANVEAWGNLLAFLEDPGEQEIEKHLNSVLKSRSAKKIPYFHMSKGSARPVPESDNNNSTESNRIVNLEDEPRTNTKNETNAHHHKSLHKVLFHKKKLNLIASSSQFIKKCSHFLYVTIADCIPNKYKPWVKSFITILKSNFFNRKKIFIVLFFLLLYSFLAYNFPEWALSLFLISFVFPLCVLQLKVVQVHSLVKSLSSPSSEKIIPIEDQQKSVLDSLQDKLVHIEDHQKKLYDKLSSLNDQQVNFSDSVGSLISDIQTKNQALDIRCKETLSLVQNVAPNINMLRCQPFPRYLTYSNSQVLVKKWSKLLGLEFTGKQLSYLAHQVCRVEYISRGRLATAIEDIVLRILVAMSVKGKHLIAVEIGSLFGICLASLAECARLFSKQVHVVAIDPLDGYYGSHKKDMMTGEVVDEDTFHYNMNLNASGIDYTLLKSLSTNKETIEHVAKTKCDVLIIDGDHSYQGVKNDFDIYMPLVSKSGYIIFDDYNVEDWPNVKEFVDKEVMLNPAVEFVGAEWRTAVFKVL